MFELDTRLANDTFELGEFKLCKLLWMNDKQYPWAILVPKVAGVKEIFELTGEQQIQLMNESNGLLAAMNEIFTADKMNVAALGNMVPQLHVHHIARFKSDNAWPAPVWGVNPSQPYLQNELQKIVLPLLERLESQLEFTKTFNE